MSKIKKMILGIALAICVFGGSVGTCYAATSGITLDMTASNMFAKFVYAEAGHRLNLTVYYEEKAPDGGIRPGEAGSTQFGNVTEVVVMRTSVDGYQFVKGHAFGDVDGNTVAATGEVIVR